MSCHDTRPNISATDDDGLDLWWTNQDQFRAFPYMRITHAARLAAAAQGAHRILEYGAGGSTLWLAQLCPHAELFVVEHDAEWRQRVAAAGLGLRACGIVTATIFMEAGDAFHQSLDNIDLALVDGKADDRPTMLADAWPRLRQLGSLFLHDAERIEYQEAIEALIGQGATVVYDDRETSEGAALLHLRKP